MKRYFIKSIEKNLMRNLEPEQHLGENLLEVHLPVLPGGRVELVEGEQDVVPVHYQALSQISLRVDK